jgi:hypothetical protein
MSLDQVPEFNPMIDAYGTGEIGLPQVPAKAANNLIRYASQGSVKHP